MNLKRREKWSLDFWGETETEFEVRRGIKNALVGGKIKGFTGLKSRLSVAEETVKKQKSAARFGEWRQRKVYTSKTGSFVGVSLQEFPLQKLQIIKVNVSSIFFPSKFSLSYHKLKIL